jgi:hypothetical protein
MTEWASSVSSVVIRVGKKAWEKFFTQAEIDNVYGRNEIEGFAEEWLAKGYPHAEISVRFNNTDTSITVEAFDFEDDEIDLTEDIPITLNMKEFSDELRAI